MRLFIGIELQPAVTAGLHCLQQKIQKQVRKGRFPGEANLHLTLYFLGETPDNKVSEIVRCLEAVAKGKSPFILSFKERLECFGSADDVRVVWLGVNDDAGALQQLQTAIAAGMQTLGFVKDSRQAYVPHITLARAACFLNKAVLQANGQIALGAEHVPPMAVERFSLIASSLKQGHRVYRTVASFALVPEILA